MNHMTRLKAIPWFDEARVSETSIAVFGVGGVGTPIVISLAKSGCCRSAKLMLVDKDVVGEENMNRDFHAGEISIPKVQAVRARIQSDVPECRVEAIKGDILLPSFQPALVHVIKEADVVIHATDDRAVRHHINALCRQEKKVLVDVASSETQSQFHIQVVKPNSGPCCECVTRATIDFPKKRRERDCTASFMPTVTAAASFAAYVVTATLILGHGRQPIYLTVDLATMTTSEIIIPIHPDCSVCNAREAVWCTTNDH